MNLNREGDMKKLIQIISVLFAAVAFSYGGDKALQSPYTIVTTCTMVTDLVKNVVGDKAQVVGLMKEGVDPHLYKPTRDDLVTLTKADVVFYSGLMLEGRMADTFAKMGRFVEMKEICGEVIALVYPDRRGKGYALTRYNDCARLDFSRLETEGDVLFCHTQGFLAKTSATSNTRILELIKMASI